MSEALGDNSAETLRGYAERILNLMQEVEDLTEQHIYPVKEQIKDVYGDAASSGFDRKALRETLRRMRLEDDLRSEVETYEAALLRELLS